MSIRSHISGLGQGYTFGTGLRVYKAQGKWKITSVNISPGECDQSLLRIDAQAGSYDAHNGVLHRYYIPLATATTPQLHIISHLIYLHV